MGVEWLPLHVCSVICTVVYGTVGVFGAARYGSETKGDILENNLVRGKLAVVLVAAVAAYLAVCAGPPAGSVINPIH
eukprot:scaffold122973_cov52-Prasinocladus_malaysianus.AAC.2